MFLIKKAIATGLGGLLAGGINPDIEPVPIASQEEQEISQREIFGYVAAFIVLLALITIFVSIKPSS